SASSYTATINWGDGGILAGDIVPDAQGGFNVIGSHVFLQDGPYIATITVSGNGGTATATSTIHVAPNGPPPVNLFPVAKRLTHSDEYFANIVVIPAYQHYLGRFPEPTGLAGWVAELRAGLSDEQLAAGFIGSPEYFLHAGGTNRSWVTFMYHDILGRDP